jgi:hypothetical protein
MSEDTQKILRYCLLSALLGGLTPAIAQTPPDAVQAEPCDPATEPCEDQSPAAESGETPDAGQPADTAESGLEAVVEEDPAIEASADEVFTPGDEISEDYPIPLPSDI